MSAWTTVRARGVIYALMVALTATVQVSASAVPTLTSSTVKLGVAPAKDASLKSLAVTAPKGINLAPTFSPTVSRYSATVPVGTAKVAFAAVATQKTSQVAVAAPATYVPGVNKATFTVTAPDKKTKFVYTIIVTVLKAPTVTVDTTSLAVGPGGFSVKVKVLNATITPTVTKDASAACAGADPYAIIKSGPDANGIVLIKVEGGTKGCSLSLGFTVTPKKGYGVVAVAPVKGVPTKDAIGFNRKAITGTSDGFTVDYSVSRATATCALSDAPSSARLTQTSTRLTVAGLQQPEPAPAPVQSATIRCVFTPAAGIDPIDSILITGNPLRQATFTYSDSVMMDDGFSVKVVAFGCVPTLTVTDPVAVTAVDVSDPVRNTYKFFVSGLVEGQSATFSIACAGLAGQFTDADPAEDLSGQATSATDLGLVVEPRIADATGASSSLTEDLLPDPVPGTQPSILYATKPDWSPWDPSAKNTFQWQISSAQYDDDGVSCMDPASTVTWNPLIPTDAQTSWWDRSLPHLLYVGDLLAQRPKSVGNCVRVAVTGTFGARTGSAVSAPVALASAQAPKTCSVLPQISGAVDDAYTTDGDVLSTSYGQCANANGLAVRSEWQVSYAAVPTRDSDWTSYSTRSSLTIPSSLKNAWLRTKVTYTAARGSRSIYSTRISVSSGSIAPVNTSAPTISCTAGTSCVGLGLSNSILRLADIGSWNFAGGSDLSVTWQYSPDGSDDSWVDQTVSDADGNAVQASYRFILGAAAGQYRAAVTFSSLAGNFDPVTVYSNVVTWAASQ